MEIDFERESDIPDEWEENKIFCLDGRGRVVEITIPDDEEEGSDNVGND